MLEQLKFTWAPKTIDGATGFGIVAVSPGLANRSLVEHNRAVSLCRYVTPAGVDSATAPLAYGWVDSNDRRYAFCRTYVGDDGNGRPGNFRSHVIVGSVRELPAGALIRRYRSSFWWTNLSKSNDESTVLESLQDLAQIPEGPHFAARAPLLEAFLDEMQHVTNPSL